MLREWKVVEGVHLVRLEQACLVVVAIEGRPVRDLGLLVELDGAHVELVADVLAVVPDRGLRHHGSLLALEHPHFLDELASGLLFDVDLLRLLDRMRSLLDAKVLREAERAVALLDQCRPRRPIHHASLHLRNSEVVSQGAQLLVGMVRAFAHYLLEVELLIAIFFALILSIEQA